jgi:hypothetical protein
MWPWLAWYYSLSLADPSKARLKCAAPDGYWSSWQALERRRHNLQCWRTAKCRVPGHRVLCTSKLAPVFPAVVNDGHIISLTPSSPHPSLLHKSPLCSSYSTIVTSTTNMARFGFGRRHAADSTSSTAVPSPTNSVDIPAVGKDAEKGNGQKLVGLPSVGVTLRTVVMTILVAMGGFIFGYDTGQISGFLEMKVFLERFGQPTSVSQDHPNGLYFTNVRSGLIVALVSSNALPLLASS